MSSDGCDRAGTAEPDDQNFRFPIPCLLFFGAGTGTGFSTSGKRNASSSCASRQPESFDEASAGDRI
jgi:hypothetical protein